MTLRWRQSTTVHDIETDRKRSLIVPKKEITVRRVFSIEYTCRVDVESGNKRCHGTVFYRPDPSADEIRKPFRDLKSAGLVMEAMLRQNVHKTGTVI